MAKLNLIIADIDEDYAKRLSEYVNSVHCRTFRVSCFTKADTFSNYIGQQAPADILLISPEFYKMSTEYSSIKLKIMLSNGALSGEYPDFQTVNKYSTGDKLISEVVHMYSKMNPSENRLSPYSKDSMLVGVYSPSGGAGKTTIAASLSIQGAESGMNSFYLNLESIQSTGIFFDCSSKRSLSYAFYYTKEKSKNLPFRLSGLKITDTGSGVQYFSPPESPLEYEELAPDELEQLIKGIKDMRCYDFIFIDMPSTFDSKNRKIMDLCDRLILVTLQEPTAVHKSRLLYNELAKQSDTDKECILDKFVGVINRYKERVGCSTDSLAVAPATSVKVPEYSRALIKEDGRLVIDDDSFRKSIEQLIEKITAK